MNVQTEAAETRVGVSAGIKPASAPPRLDVEAVRGDFPILATRVYDKPLVYLDNAATTQKPQAVLDAIATYYAEQNANIHRGVHWLSQLATKKHDAARETVRSFLNARETAEIIFVRGTTEAINLVASTYGRANLRAGDEIVISHMEHHSNIVPWQMLCEATGAVLRVVPIDERGVFDLEAYRGMLSERTKLVSVVHISNALGTINPVARITELAHEVGAVVLLDGAQAVGHAAVDVQALGCDFYAFSGHKLFGPTGIGALYGRRALLEAMPPYQGGGDMIRSVSFEKTIYAELPYKFEAGTPDIAGPIGLAAAIDYVRGLGFDAIARHEAALLAYGTERLAAIPGVRLVGTAPEKAAVLSFVIEGVHPHDIGTVLDREGIAIRTGHHCAQPVMDRYGVPATARASLAFYNTFAELDVLERGVRFVQEIFGR
jgi:cysteine desulfurase/selenocysteine lyase